MLWFALHLSALSLEAWLAAAPPASGPQAGAACASCVAEARRVVFADAASRAAGVEAGMSVATASSLVAGLRVFARDAAREAAQVQRVALVLARFTPSLVLQSDGVLIEVSASLRLFGGARPLWRAVQASVKAAGVRSLSMAASPTATAAWVLARVEARSPALRRRPVRERLDALPLPGALAAWGIEPRLGDLLHGIGCRTLGDVRLLPRTGARRRGAAPLLDAIARAHGEAPDPQAWLELPRRFEMGLELLHRADDAGSLVFAAQRLVQPLAGWLAQQWLAAARVTLVLRHEASGRHTVSDTAVTLALGDPSRDAAQITLLLRERLARTTLSAPVYAITLRLDEAVNQAGRASPLWRERGGADGEHARALFDRLAARLGAERVLRPVLADDHRPERAVKWVPAGTPLQPAQAQPKKEPPRPAWLLPAPLRLAEAPGSGQPLHQGKPLALLGRAERIEAGWFDGELVCRDYQVARAGDQRWLWVFRERRGEAAHWYLHGMFG